MGCRYEHQHGRAKICQTYTTRSLVKPDGLLCKTFERILSETLNTYGPERQSLALASHTLLGLTDSLAVCAAQRPANAKRTTVYLSIVFQALGEIEVRFLLPARSDYRLRGEGPTMPRFMGLKPRTLSKGEAVYDSQRTLRYFHPYPQFYHRMLTIGQQFCKLWYFRHLNFRLTGRHTWKPLHNSAA